jgi:hypothetical protein
MLLHINQGERRERRLLLRINKVARRLISKFLLVENSNIFYFTKALDMNISIIYTLDMNISIIYIVYVLFRLDVFFSSFTY